MYKKFKIDIYHPVYIYKMGAWMYELGTVRARIGQIILNLLIIFFIVVLGLIVVEVILKCLVIHSPF